MATEKNAVKNLFNNLKSTIEEQVETPLQVITASKGISIKNKTIKDESPFTLHLPKNRLKMLKVKSAEDDISIKELINQAIYRQYGI